MKGWPKMPNNPGLGATNMQLETRVKALETWRTTIAIDAYKAATKATIDALTARIAKLEARPTGGTTDLTALTARVAKLETTPCGQEARIKVLEDDHIPTP